MKQILIILGLFASVSTFAQSPRIKLNQITKDTVKGSVLISSPSDSGMVYSRDFYISYGADTVLILGGDTLAATSSIISSVLSDNVTITGDGTTGSELTVDTATVIATKGDLSDYVTIAGTETITGAKTFSSTVTGTSNLRAPKIQVGTSATINDVTGVANTLQLTNYTPTAFVTGSADNYIYKNSNGFGGLNAHSLIFQTRSDIDGGGFAFVGGSTPSAVVTILSSGSTTINSNVTIKNSASTFPLIIDNSVQGYVAQEFKSNNVTFGYIGNANTLNSGGSNTDMVLRSQNELILSSSGIERMRIDASGDVGIGTTSPGQKLEVNGKVKISDLTGTGGNAVYENGGVLGVASDARFKSHIADLDNGIEKILNLKPKYFIDNRNSAFQQLGFYAQEVKSVINEASYPIGNTEYLGINDRAIIAVTVKAIQEQQSIIESQASKIETLKTLITDLTNRLTILENK